MLIWIVGLSGAGKTTLGRALVTELRDAGRSVVMLDGDEMRRILKREDATADYRLPARLKLVEQYHHLCRWLDEQHIDVVCCTIGLSSAVLERNRAEYSEYFEIFLDAPLEMLEARDPKGLYRRARAGETSDVVGIDIPFPPPAAPDLAVSVRADMPAADVLAAEVATTLLGGRR
jgi:cytidine diphosphoramidate kinase